MLNRAVQSLKIDEKTQEVYGTIDEAGDDETFYDSVIMASEVGAVQRIMNATSHIYKRIPNIASVINEVKDKYIDRMRVAPDYKVCYFSLKHKLLSIHKKNFNFNFQGY
jgi:hypothetical protein